jgi:hypothetical protein
VFRMQCSSVGDRMVKSKLVCYFSKTKVGSDSSIGANRCLLARRKPAEVAVKMPAVRLSKSRSMGMLNNPRLVQCKRRAFVFDFGNLEGIIKQNSIFPSWRLVWMTSLKMKGLRNHCFPCKTAPIVQNTRLSSQYHCPHNGCTVLSECVFVHTGPSSLFTM